MASLTRSYDQRKLLGQVYTPMPIVTKILDETGFTTSGLLGKKILDPACGDGRFLVEIARRILQFSTPENVVDHLHQIYGWDIDYEALELCREALDELVSPLGLHINWNLEKKDALRQRYSKEKFDYIIGNPPYIRIQHLEPRQRLYLQNNYTFCSSGSTDSFVAFFELANALLSSDGICGFITPNSYFFSETARPLRHFFQEKRNLQLITNYGSVPVFDKTGTYAAITVFGKTEQTDFRYELSDSSYQFQTRMISFEELATHELWQLSISRSADKSGVRLGDICKISVGLTTLCDRIFIFSNLTPLSETIVEVQTKSGTKIQLEAALLKPIIKASRLKKGGTEIHEYILFPYQKDKKGKHKILSETFLQEYFPLSYTYLLSQKKALNQRDNGKPNPVAWYAFGRSQSLDSAFGKKIIFSPMNKSPLFLLSEHTNATLYSGYFIKYEGDYTKLLAVLNSPQMADYMAVAGRDFRGGWKGYSKKIVENFRFDPEALR
ncbi:Eco57I restriction-modification methylase domain-containing protein [Arundinibacter roseus]|uniref:site-specific DNA-methyltransferase (adenine-specific) n=1 Tax=Arundinibacter roseus TaxID=2070510 RepID=A0A4R4KA29_9BACT|nr:N-6 DNA methylase [Arundinibacter roseus]TDB64610.1 methyltransferase domain-containing protein [Arundinibacter roseus]